MTKLTEGDVAPAFGLPDPNDKVVALSDYLGRRVVVYFYPADDTPGCTKEACQFSDLLDDYTALGVEVIGISPDAGDKHKKFKAKYGLRVSLLSDPTHEVMTLYGAFGLKTLYGRTTEGVIRSTFLVGADGRVENAWYNVRADGHAAKVLQALVGDQR
jgi:peroxiredoxin Q/BCP